MPQAASVDPLATLGDLHAHLLPRVAADLSRLRASVAKAIQADAAAVAAGRATSAAAAAAAAAATAASASAAAAAARAERDAASSRPGSGPPFAEGERVYTSFRVVVPGPAGGPPVSSLVWYGGVVTSTGPPGSKEYVIAYDDGDVRSDVLEADLQVRLGRGWGGER